MKKNNFFIVLTLLSIGCSKSKDAPTLLSQLEKNFSDDKIVERKLATAADNKCFRDIYSVDLLKSEIREYEKKHASGTRVTGKWKHLDFKDLPIPQANFLKTYGNRLGDLNDSDAFDYSACKNVPCIFNKIYGKDDSIAGYVHYLWYLKMGSYLAANNNVYAGVKITFTPGIYNEKPFKVSDYLWKEDELYGFWRLLQMMEEPHTQLSDLKEIQRVPHGEYYGFKSSSTCGLAWSSGWISMQDACLSVGSDIRPSSFYDSVLHELNHQVDFHEGRKLSQTYRSRKDDYMKLSKFRLETYKDPETKETVEKWHRLPGDIKDATWYAGSSAAENFAETIAHFRLNGSTVKPKITKEHWDFTSKGYFSNKSFEDEVLIKNWIAGQGPMLAQLAFKAVEDCSKNGAAKASTFFKKEDFDQPLLPSMMNCLGDKSADISRDLRAKIKMNDPDGCRVLLDHKMMSEWMPLLKSQLATLMNKYLTELKSDRDYFAKVQSFYDEIPNRSMASQAYLSCYGEEKEEACYKKNVIDLALDKLSALNLPIEHAQDLARLYLDYHLISDTRQHLKSTYKSFVMSHREITNRVAEDNWRSCSVVVNDESPPRGQEFTISDGYMVSSIYNCLNLQFPDMTEDILRDLSVNGMKSQHPNEVILLRQEVVPELKAALLRMYQSETKKESEAVGIYILRNTEILRKELLSDMSWVKDVLNPSLITSDCQKTVQSKINFPLRYHIRSQTFSKLIEDVCFNIEKSDEYNALIEISRGDFEAKALVSLQNIIVNHAAVQAQVCLEKYPVDTNLNRVKFKAQREACLIDAWPSIEEKAVKELGTNPLVSKFNLDPYQLMSKIEPTRRRLQLRVIKEHF